MSSTNTAPDQPQCGLEIRLAHPATGTWPSGVCLATATSGSALKKNSAAVAGEGYVDGVGVGE